MFGISNVYMEQLLDRLNLQLFDGVYSSNNIPPELLMKAKTCFICNLSKVNEIGSHFITIFKDEKKMWIFDSLALPLTHFPSELAQLFAAFKTSFVYQNQLQRNSSHFCGFYCIFFVLRLNAKQEPKLIKFTNPKDNDNVCIENILKLIKHLQNYSILFKLFIFNFVSRV